MSKTQLESITDILPPPPPPSSTGNIEIIIFSLILLIFLSLVTYHYRSEKQQLKRLIKKHDKKIINQREMAFELIRFLKKKSTLANRLSHKAFHSQLQAACYSRNGIDQRIMEKIIRRVEKWI